VAPSDSYSIFKPIAPVAIVLPSKRPAERYTMGDPADLLHVAIERLIEQRFEPPAVSILDRLALHTRHGVREDLYRRITSSWSALKP
jgi:hypothetical protein